MKNTITKTIFIAILGCMALNAGAKDFYSFTKEEQDKKLIAMAQKIVKEYGSDSFGLFINHIAERYRK